LIKDNNVKNKKSLLNVSSIYNSNNGRSTNSNGISGGYNHLSGGGSVSSFRPSSRRRAG
jgi:hypothetical protein